MKEMIAAQLLTGAIGLNGDLMKKDKDDLAFFRRVTMNKVCVVGRKTAQTLPNLEGRQLCIVTSQNSVKTRQKHPPLIIHRIEDIPYPDYVVIGGGQIYQAMLYSVDKIYLTTFYEYDFGDVYFPSLNMNMFVKTWQWVYPNKRIEAFERM